MHTQTISYSDEGTELEGFIAHNDKEKSPLVILCHAWAGRDQFICEKARTMAEWGYVGFALDMYGKGVLGRSREENAALKAPFLKDRTFLQRRLLKALETAYSLPYVDTKRIAVLGFGFGGICALDFARSGVDLKAAITVYGHFEPPLGIPQKPIKAKILILHGYLDPIVSPDELRAFEKEMDEANVDWQAHIYGAAMHAFTNPSAKDPSFGTLYNPAAAKRAQRCTQNFLGEIFHASQETK